VRIAKWQACIDLSLQHFPQNLATDATLQTRSQRRPVETVARIVNVALAAQVRQLRAGAAAAVALAEAAGAAAAAARAKIGLRSGGRSNRSNSSSGGNSAGGGQQDAAATEADGAAIEPQAYAAAQAELAQIGAGIQEMAQHMEESSEPPRP
jgi:hypothetical protein